MNKINDRKKVRTLSDKLSSSKRNTEENFVFKNFIAQIGRRTRKPALKQ